MNFILQENGEPLLQENGEAILLEQSVALPGIVATGGVHVGGSALIDHTISIPAPAFAFGGSTSNFAYPNLYPILKRRASIVGTGGVIVSGSAFPRKLPYAYTIAEMNALIILLDELGEFDPLPTVRKPYAYTIAEMNALILRLDEVLDEDAA